MVLTFQVNMGRRSSYGGGNIGVMGEQRCGCNDEPGSNSGYRKPTLISSGCEVGMGSNPYAGSGDLVSAYRAMMGEERRLQTRHARTAVPYAYMGECSAQEPSRASLAVPLQQSCQGASGHYLLITILFGCKMPSVSV
jgi:hypothetical protein